MLAINQFGTYPLFDENFDISIFHYAMMKPVKSSNKDRNFLFGLALNFPQLPKISAQLHS
jgi:hypothetical protein